jgi:UDP:flavonoid glycosyltransferase YjiC (YdhE family)
MRVLFTTWAWPSHYKPMVPLAWALRAAGHDLRIASQPALMPTIERSGLPAVVTGRDLDMVAYHRRELEPIRVEQRAPQAPGEWDEAKRRRVQRTFLKFAEIAELMADDLVGFARYWRPDLVVHDPLTYAGPLVAAVLGVPAVRNLFGPDFTYGTRHLEAEVVAGLARRFGLDGLDTVSTLTVDPVPPSLQFAAPIRRHLVRYVPYSGFGPVPGWLLDPPRGRRVAITWGTSTTKFSGDHGLALPQVVEAISSLDVEVVLVATADQLELFDRLPAQVRVAEAVPLEALLPTCDAIVHHGGASTTLNSALVGVPQLIVAHTPDQIVNAIPLARTAAGCYLIPSETDPQTVRARVQGLLEDVAYRAAAGKLSREMEGQPPPAAAVPVLERLVAGDRSEARTLESAVGGSRP